MNLQLHNRFLQPVLLQLRVVDTDQTEEQIEEGGRGEWVDVSLGFFGELVEPNL